MRRHHHLIGIFLLMILVTVPSASAQFGSRLTPNKTRNLEHEWGYGNAYYFANLTAGSWTVVASSDSFWGMSFVITVSDSNTSEVLAISDPSGSSRISLQLVLDEDTVVNIVLEEVSGEAGYYDIGVYNGFNAIYATHGILLIIVPVLTVGVIIALGYVVKSRGRSTDPGVRVEAPEFAIPESYRQRPETSDIRTVRLSAKCPSCGASLSQEDIDWTGPLEAKCNYCGSVVRARLEKI